ncbi:S1 family peptidase [Stenotrophomonas maltophilia]|uniref:S1 family peptidase n=1 Tax=Stenotrophomonas maltophilia TaxID=40324 RepID=UPI00105573C7|nr:S1 family peptidase [Stenotrophomonas maltophilia]
MKHLRIAGIAAAALLSFYSSHALCSSELGNEDNSTPIATYSRMFGVSKIEAEARFLIMAESTKVQEILRTKYPTTFGGLYVEHQPQFRVVVRFTDSPAESLRAVTADPAFVALPASHSLAELSAAQQAVGEELHRNGINFLSRLDLEHSTVEFSVEDPQAVEQPMRSLRSEIPFIRFKKTTGFLQPTLLEISLSSAQKLKEPPGSYCTSGFGVKSGTTRGITTAGHCDNTLTHSGNRLTFQAEKKSGSEDIQWHTYPDTSRYHYVPSHRVEAGSQSRIMVAVRPRSGMKVGDIVCKYGKSTYETCGLITDLKFQATFENAIGEFVRVVSPEGRTMTDFGDSGGPVYGTQKPDGRFYDTAYGMVHGRGNSGTEFYKDLFFMPTDYFASLGLQILTTADDP